MYTSRKENVRRSALPAEPGRHVCLTCRAAVLQLDLRGFTRLARGARPAPTALAGLVHGLSAAFDRAVHRGMRRARSLRGGGRVQHHAMGVTISGGSAECSLC